MDLPAGFHIGAMREDEVPILEDWAAKEGWNPGLADLQIAHAIDPEAFIALREGEHLAGGGTIFRHGPRLGFMGLFIMRADLRQQGLGAILWTWRRDAMLRRLEPGATVGMDGVFAMVPFYEKGGFRLAYRDLRYQGIARGRGAAGAELLGDAAFSEIEALDRACFGAPRNSFLARWLAQEGAHVLGLRQAGRLVAYGVARPCRVGFKIGPLFADSAEYARRVLADILARVDGQQVQIDVPEPNEAGLRIAADFGLAMTFGCARLYLGPDPELPVKRIFGVTSFEFG